MLFLTILAEELYCQSGDLASIEGRHRFKWEHNVSQAANDHLTGKPEAKRSVCCLRFSVLKDDV